MKNLIYFIVIFQMALLFSSKLQAQDEQEYITEGLTVDIDSHKLHGTLTIPDSKTPLPVVLIIAGSGPTDRDGNQKEMRSDTYKQMAEELYRKGIATVRYDKRGVGESTYFMDETNLRFDQFIDDAAKWIQLLKNDKRFSKVVVAGHSEGSLLGMVAGRKAQADAYISLEGAAKPIDELLRF